MICENTFYDYIVKCPDAILVNAYLDPTTEYKWVITDKFSKQHSGWATTDADGHFEIPVDDLPAGLLTQYSGSFTLELFSGPYGADQCQQIAIPMANYFDSVTFHVKAGTNEKSNLGCEV